MYAQPPKMPLIVPMLEPVRLIGPVPVNCNPALALRERPERVTDPPPIVLIAWWPPARVMGRLMICALGELLIMLPPAGPAIVVSAPLVRMMALPPRVKAVEPPLNSI